MSFLKRIFGGKANTANEIAFIRGAGTFDIDIVGESRYQANLEKLCGKRNTQGEEKIVTATLILEDTNPIDNQAVRVDIDGLTVGYFTTYGAKQFRNALKKTSVKSQTIQCQAMIVGGWKRGNEKGHYGVKLDLPHD